MAGYVIENLRSGLVEQHHWDQVAPAPGLATSETVAPSATMPPTMPACST